MPDGDVMIEALWEENKTADYTVEFYVQKVSDAPDLPEDKKSYDYFRSETVTNYSVGKIPKISAGYQNYGETLGSAHFKYNSAQTEKALANQTVKADGSTVVKVYYDRDVITINFEYASEEEAKKAAKDYGGEVIGPSKNHFQAVTTGYVNPRDDQSGLGWKNVSSDEWVYKFQYWNWGRWQEDQTRPITEDFKVSHDWGWEYHLGKLWRFGYYENDKVCWKGLYGAPFKQEGSDYYEFEWNGNKIWKAEEHLVRDVEVTFLDCFKVSANPNVRDVTLISEKRTPGEKKVYYVTQELNPSNNWKVQEVITSDDTFKCQVMNVFEGFNLMGYSTEKKYSNTVEIIQNPTIYTKEGLLGSTLILGDLIGNLGWFRYNNLQLFYSRKPYYLNYKNINKGRTNVLYQDSINNHLPSDEEIEAHKDDYIPADVDKDFIFDGWYDSISEDAKPIDKDALMPAQPFTVFAHWKAPEYTVTVHYKTDPAQEEWTEKEVKVPKYSVADSEDTKYNEKLAKILNSEVNNENYEFDAWYYDTNFEQMYNKADPILGDIDLYADYTQKKGEKKVKVRYVTKDKDGNSLYFKVGKDGKILYDEKGNVRTVKDKESHESYYYIVGEIGQKRTITAPVVKDYRPQQSDREIIFSNDLDEIVILYHTAQTWKYTIECKLKEGTLMQEITKYTSSSQMVESAPEFSGFTVDEKSIGYQIIKENDKPCIFEYNVDNNYCFELMGEYKFSSNTYAVVTYDGESHKVMTVEKSMGTLPKEVKEEVKYYKVGNENPIDPPVEKGNYYATVKVKIGDTQIGKMLTVYLDIK